MKTVSLTIDGVAIEAPEGQKVLWAALDHGIYIPNLCALREKATPDASCRLCFVEIAGRERPVTACTQEVSEGMVVNTRGAAARKLARTSLELLLSTLPVDCAHCPANRGCELQRIAAHLGVKLNSKRFPKVLRELPVDESSPVFTYDPNKCVLCGRCVWVCHEVRGIGAIGFTRRGFERVVTTFCDDPLASSRCDHCGDCVALCPVSALTFKEGRGARPLTSGSAGA